MKLLLVILLSALLCEPTPTPTATVEPTATPTAYNTPTPKVTFERPTTTPCWKLPCRLPHPTKVNTLSAPQGDVENIAPVTGADHLVIPICVGAFIIALILFFYSLCKVAGDADDIAGRE